jgi:two-component SAPR family response regulator
MKRIAVLLTGIAAFIGTPVLLATVAGRPWMLANDLLAEWHLASASDRFVWSGILLLWLLWAWVAVSVGVEAIRYWRGASDPDRITTRLTMLFLAAVSTVALPRAVVAPPSTSLTETREGSEENTSHPLLRPLGLTASLFAVAHVLQLVHDRRQLAIRTMKEGNQFAPVRGSDAMFWRSLHFAGTQRRGDVQVAIGTEIPLGKQGDAVLSAPIQGGDSVGVASTNSADARAVVRHVEWMAESVSKNGYGSPVSVSLGLRDGQRIQIAQDDLGWRLVSSGERFDVFGVSDDENDKVMRLIDLAVATESRQMAQTHTAWRVLVRLMGPVTVELPNGQSCCFEKSRSIELLSWLVTHRGRPVRSAARTAMWETNVQNATFNNVVSDLRTALQASMDESEDVALGKTFDEYFALHPSVISDVDLLDAAVQSYCNNPDEHTRETLRSTLSLVRDMPFLGADYLWPDPEGITSNIVHLIVSASQLLAEDDLVRGNTKNVFAATGQGLKVLRGHEGLIGLRMRAYALEGNTSGVLQEWERYESVLRGQYGEQDWLSAQLRQLRDELLCFVAVD